MATEDHIWLPPVLGVRRFQVPSLTRNSDPPPAVIESIQEAYCETRTSAPKSPKLEFKPGSTSYEAPGTAWP